MNEDELFSELKRLKFEDFICVVVIILSIININGDYCEKEYILTKDNIYKSKANKIFEFTLIVTFFIYIYFIARNYYFYKKTTPENKKLYLIKLFGSSLLLAGIICLIYFQVNQTSFIGEPAL
ncbi:MAG: hypothetical protein J1F35_01375 [Erysipelotrichales bacterium]|nr:hypothetical protein [Erysipelotrichales bacterium]